MIAIFNYRFWARSGSISSSSIDLMDLEMEDIAVEMPIFEVHQNGDDYL